ncbi:MAG: tol-pal system YbgF family protein [Candidatus Zixiibacteriota bacterium]
MVFGGQKLYAGEILDFAENLFNLERYEEAITEYKRFIFFNPDDHRIDHAFHKLGLCYKAQGNWEKAIKALRMSIQTADDDSLKEERKVESGIIQIACGKYSQAQLQLLRVAHFGKYPSTKKKAQFFLGVCYIYLFDWVNAKKALSDFYSGCNQQSYVEKKELVDSLLINAQSLPYKSVGTAKVLSTFLPGAGQLYVGNWKKSLNALAINSATAFLLWDSIENKDYLSVSFSGFLFLRYYLGNRYHAVQDVKRYNERMNIKQTEKILKILNDQ